ncbi:DUF3572 family protein [Stakelama marina]|uniref:DUF3572 family protein n=1 Tax=Stakelama marina TaxID=2826939 RepID=A0A8T4IJJ0_9SPHN|nr:DUF3572 family protein [Stakelama marina]MBR0553275.1 DUF3572 family protein [Stakelama marina]
MPERDTNKDDAIVIGLGALGWIVSADDRARRFLDLTGIDLPTLRDRAGDPVFLAAAILFLEAYEPDLLACADALAMTPEALVSARRELEE